MPRMPGRDNVIKAAVAVHLVIAALYGLHVHVEDYLPRAIDRPLSLYGNLSGARSRYDFFAPAVPSEARADFLIVPANGPSRRVRLVTANAEANRRLALMYTIYSFPSERENLMLVWSDYVLRRNADAVEVTSRVEVLEIPTMKERAAGKAASWTEVGRATVRRGQAPGR